MLSVSLLPLASAGDPAPCSYMNTGPADPAKLTSVDVSVAVTDEHATTVETQTFENPSSVANVARVTVPIDYASRFVTDLQMTVDGVTYEADIAERGDACGRFSESVDENIRPYLPPPRDPLLEFKDASHYSMSVIVKPGATERVTITTEEILPASAGLSSWSWQTPTGAVGLGSVTIKVSASSSSDLSSFTAAGATVARPDARHATASWSGIVGSASVSYGRLAPKAELSTYDSGSDHLFALTIHPDDSLLGGHTALGRDAVVLVDASGSMKSQKAQIKTAVDSVIAGLSPGRDRFSIVAMGGTPRSMGTSLQVAGPSSKTDAHKFLDGLSYRGSTNLGKGIDASMGVLKNSDLSRSVQTLVVVSDGKVTSGSAAASTLSQQVGKGTAQTRADLSVVSLQVGSGTSLLGAFTVASGGTIAGSTAEVGTAVGRDVPIARDGQLSFAGPVSELTGQDFDLRTGGSVLITGKYDGNVASLVSTLTATAGDGQFTASITPTLVGSDAEVVRLHAFQELATVLADIRAFGEKQDLVATATQLGLEHRVVTPYTSFVLVVPDPGSHPTVATEVPNLADADASNAAAPTHTPTINSAAKLFSPVGTEQAKSDDSQLAPIRDGEVDRTIVKDSPEYEQMEGRISAAPVVAQGSYTTVYDVDGDLVAVTDSGAYNSAVGASLGLDLLIIAGIVCVAVLLAKGRGGRKVEEKRKRRKPSS